MRYLAFGILCFCFVLCACREQAKEDMTQSAIIQAGNPSSSPSITVFENLTDSLKPKMVMLKDTSEPASINIPTSNYESFELKDQSQDVKKIIPPPIHPRQSLQNENGEIILDPSGKPYFLGDGGLSHFTSFTTDNGLALDNITSTILDGAGNLWFGTWGGGISKFDGMTFNNFTTANGLANNLVHCLAQDSDGNIWIGTDGGGISIYDGYTFSTITKAQGLGSDLVYSIFQDSKGAMWIATGEGGATKYDGSNFITYDSEAGLPSNYILAIAEDQNGNIWFASGNRGVAKYDGSTFTHFTTENGLADNAVNCIKMDLDGSLWFGTKSGGVSKYREIVGLEENGFFTNYSIYDGLGNNEIWNITVASDGNIWFATGGGGVSKYDGQKFTTYTTAQGLPENRVYSIVEDLSGNLWFGTSGGGVSLYHGTAFSNYNSDHGLAKSTVFSISEDNSGNLWFGTDGGGISKYDGKAFTTYGTDQGLAHPLVISSLKDKNGNLWFGTGGGGVSLYQESKDRSQKASFTTYTSRNGLQNDVIYAILEDHIGQLWFGTGGGGLVMYDGNIVTGGEEGFTSYTIEQGLADNTVYSLFEDSQRNIWIGTAGGGVSKYDGKSFTNFSSKQGLANNIIWAIVEDKVGNLWFATQGGGVSRYDGTEFSSFTSLEGLVDDTVYDLLVDEKGNLFIGTNRGFTLIPAHAVDLPFFEIRPHLEYYNTSYGYPVKDVNAGVFQDSKGILWAGNGSDKTGLVKFDYSALSKKSTPTNAKIKNISLNEKTIDWKDLHSSLSKNKNAIEPSLKASPDKVGVNNNIPGDREKLQGEMAGVKFASVSRFDNYPEKLILPYSLNHITIEFGTDELARPNLVEYQYILEGYTKNWSPILKKSSATFGNIWEGDYTFKVVARYAGPSEDNVKDWSEAAVYRFTVLPPWYRSWWAYLVYFAILLLAVRRVHVFQKVKTIRKERYLMQSRELEQAKEIEKAYKELKITQAQLIQAEKMASLGELTAGIAHEIQNPLNFVNNFSEVSSELVEELKEARAKSQETRSRTEEDDLEIEILENIKHNLEKITHHGKRADAIVKGMLEHSISGLGEKELTDVNTLTMEYLNLAYQSFVSKNKDLESTPIAISSDLDPSLPIINLVRSDIGKVLLNIFNNAFYACTSFKPKTGSSGLKIYQDSDFEKENGYDRFKNPSVSLSTKNLGDIIEISVFDNGCGIPEEIKDKIFQPFFTTKPPGQGTGLGLSLSYDIIKAHGGELKVESEENVGTTFYIYLKI